MALLDTPVYLILKNRMCDISMKQVNACLKVVCVILIMDIRDLELVHRDRGRGPIETAIG